MLAAAIFIPCSHISTHRLPYLRSFLPHYLLHVITQFCLGLQFSDKKFFRGIRNKTKHGSSDGIPPVPRNSVPNHFSDKKNPWNSVLNHFWTRKTSEFRSKLFPEEEKPRNSFPTIFEEKKPRNSVPNHFWKRKNFGISFRTNFWRRKPSKIRSKPFLGTENTRKKTTFFSCFVKRHYFAEFRFVPFRSELRN